MRPALTLAVLAAATVAASAAGSVQGPMSVGSTAIGADHRIAARNTAYGANLSPEVDWSPVPGARAYAVILDDPDAGGVGPFVHWLVWNIPARAGRLAEGAVPAGAVQGRNGHGATGYWGPHPPSGTHHYHLRVFALDAPLALPAGSDPDALASALSGHVISSGEAIGLASPPGR